jgi:hypothetical protein
MNIEKNKRVAVPALVLLLLAGTNLSAATAIATNTPAESLTRARISELPPAQRSAWLNYLERSERQRLADKDAFQAELKCSGITAPTEPPHGFAAHGIVLDRDASWYASVEARRVADNIVSFQTPVGGWGKNMDMSKEARRPGERYGPNNLSRFLEPGDFDEPKEPDWNYIGTIDNDATITQIRGCRRKGCGCISRSLSSLYRLSAGGAVSQRRMAAGVAVRGRLSRRHHL